jgi:3-dehydroquinate synthase II
MKELWVDIRPWNKALATVAIESGADVIVTDQVDRVRELGRVRVVGPDGDLVPDCDVFECTIAGKADEERASALAARGYVIVDTADWTVIPLENLISRSDRIIARVKDEREAALALQVLEKGVRGVLIRPSSGEEIRKCAAHIHAAVGAVRTVPFTITAIRQVGMGDRVCVDTCSVLEDGDGMLVGNTSSGLLMVHPETLENPYVAPRPFRVNAGAVHAYILRPDGTTAYLSDLRIGDRVLVADSCGTGREAIVGRVKIERRPLLLVEAEAEGSKASLVLQNAETIRLVGEDGSARSVVSLQPGDRIMGCVLEGGRHFGVAIKETIIEK